MILFFFRRNCPLLFFWIQNSMSRNRLVSVHDQNQWLCTFIDTIVSVASNSVNIVIFFLFFNVNLYYSVKMLFKKRLLCIIKLNKWKAKKRFRVQKHVRTFNCWNWSFFFYYVLLFAAIWWTAIQCSRFDIFQLYSACVFYYIIFLHTIEIQLRTIWPVRDCINLHNNKFYEFSYD